MPQRAAELEPGRRRAQTSRRTSSGALLGTGPDAPITLEGSTKLEAPGHPNDPLETAESLNSDGASTATSTTEPTRAALARRMRHNRANTGASIRPAISTGAAVRAQPTTEAAPTTVITALAAPDATARRRIIRASVISSAAIRC